MFEQEEPTDETNVTARYVRAGERVLKLLLISVAGLTIILSVGLMVAMGGGRTHLAGRLTIAVAALVVLGALDTQATRLAQRHRPLLAPDSPGYRRFVVWSALGMLAAAVLLLGLAWFLPEAAP